MPPETDLAATPNNALTDQQRTVVLEPQNSRQLANFCGALNANLVYIERQLDVVIHQRGGQFQISGTKSDNAADLLHRLYALAANQPVNIETVNLHLMDSLSPAQSSADNTIRIKTRRGEISGRGDNQAAYLRNIGSADVTFGIGPAGTGKTFLAVACAVDALEKQRVSRLVLVRPAVEAGERLGFLPGDMAQKVDPYLRPLFDALYEMLGFEKVDKLMERNVIEVAPLAFMRGRTLNDAFIILDEAQNTTVEQMKMFLTRIGFGSCVVVTGDITQVDLAKHQVSGLRHVISVLDGVDGVKFTNFQSRDVVRHPLVQRIVEAYQRTGDAEPGH